MTTDDTSQPHSADSFEDGTFAWNVPDTFNFSTDVVDRWAADPDRLALITVDEAGHEQFYSYADIAAAASRLANLLAAQGL